MQSTSILLIRLLPWFRLGAAAVVLMAGVAILYGWHIGDNDLKSLLEKGDVTINPLVAIELLLGGLGLGLLSLERSRLWRSAGAVCGALVALVALGKIVGYVSLWERPVDTWFFYLKLDSIQMDPNTALAFLLLGLAMATLDWGSARRYRLSQPDVVLLLALAVLSLSISLKNIAIQYGAPWYIPIVGSAAPFYLLLCLGLICARPQREPVASLLDSTVGGRLARSLLPFAIIVPLGLEWLRLQGETFYGDEFGFSLFSLVCVLAFNALLWSQAYLLARVDRQRQRGEVEVKRSEQRFRLLFEGSNDAIYVCDRQGRFIEANQRTEELLGCRRQDLLARHFADFVERAEKRRVFSVVRRVLEGDAVRFEALLTRADGKVIAVETSASLVDAERGLMQGISRDVSARKEAEQRLRATQAEAEAARSAADAANRAKSEFLANMSHEIRTPMNAIIGFADLLDMTALDAQQRDYVQTVKSSSQALLGLINDILDFSKVEAGKLDLESVPFSLRDVVEGVADMFREKTAIKEVELVVDIDTGISDALVGDPLRLRQVLVNLAGNAVKFTEAGQVSIEVKGGEQDGDLVAIEFAVRDTGPGIEEHTLAGLFRAFVQADASTTRRHGGTGLGLSICKGIVERMGGAIVAESKIGSGSRFSFALSFAVQTEKRDEQRVLPAVLRDQCVLVVDDNSDNVQVAKHMLKLFGFDCESASSGLEALEKMRHRPFGLVLMDCFMPGMDGLEASRQIRADKDLAATPIIMMTAFGKERERRRAEEIGVDAFLVKPVKMSLLFDLIVEVSSGEGGAITSAQEVDKLPVFAADQRILLVEDNAVNQKLAQILLRRAGLEVEVAENGLLALHAVGKEHFAAVLMDVQMPVMDGIDATRAIRRLPAGGDVPIIAMTAEAMQGDREKCLAAGMDSYVRKPIDRNELFVELGKLIGTESSAVADPQPRGLTPDSEPVCCATEEGDWAGIDIDDVLARVMDDRDMLAELAADFVDEFSTFDASVAAEIAAGDLQTALRSFHSLKGAAGNMGAHALSELARQCEFALRDDEVEKVHGLVASLTAELRTVCESLRNLSRTGAADSASVASAESAIEPARLAPDLLVDLERALDDADPVEARVHLQALRAAQGSGDGEKLEMLIRAVDDFDFDLARVLLKELCKQNAPEELAAVES